MLEHNLYDSNKFINFKIYNYPIKLNYFIASFLFKDWTIYYMESLLLTKMGIKYKIIIIDFIRKVNISIFNLILLCYNIKYGLLFYISKIIIKKYYTFSHLILLEFIILITNATIHVILFIL